MVRVIDFPSGPSWRQRVQLQGRSYILRASWNTHAGQWLFSVSDRNDLLIFSHPLVLDNPMMGGVMTDRRPPGEFFVVSPSGDARLDPGRGSFGEDGYRLIYVEADS